MSEYKESNREKSRQAKRCLSLCGCDRRKVSLTEKCLLCGRQLTRKKLKINPPKE